MKCNVVFNKVSEGYIGFVEKLPGALCPQFFSPHFSQSVILKIPESSKSRFRQFPNLFNSLLILGELPVVIRRIRACYYL